MGAKLAFFVTEVGNMFDYKRPMWSSATLMDDIAVSVHSSALGRSTRFMVSAVAPRNEHSLNAVTSLRLNPAILCISARWNTFSCSQLCFPSHLVSARVLLLLFYSVAAL